MSWTIGVGGTDSSGVANHADNRFDDLDKAEEKESILRYIASAIVSNALNSFDDAEFFVYVDAAGDRNSAEVKIRLVRKDSLEQSSEGKKV